MAVLSRPSLRSSARRNTSVDEVPPTETQGALSQPRRGKRTRDNSIGSASNTSVKKLKITPPKLPDHLKGSIKGHALTSLPLRDKPGTRDAVTSRLDSPPPKPNSSTITTSTSTNDGSSTSKTQSLPINTSNSLSLADKRSLRSHDGGSRSKSELALYFPNYDELVSIEAKEPDFLTPETLLYIIDEPSSSKSTTGSASSKQTNGFGKDRSSSSQPAVIPNGSSHALELSEGTFTELNNATRIDISSIDMSTRQQKDPLNDAFYLKAHRRAERQEKQLRNIEKERAMHEKVQLERLMDGLRGHDWLRVMGISGITDGEKKAYEPKRDFFIQEVRVLLKKFQEWKEEEKRRKVEKEDSMQDEDEEQEDEVSDSGGESDGDPPDYNDVDASAARQLRQEAILAATAPGQVRSHRRKEPVEPPGSEKTFKSFYSKPYLRDAAIGKHRRGRTRSAFGRPLPEPPDQDFELGDDILTPEVLAAQERKIRVLNRHNE